MAGEVDLLKPGAMQVLDVTEATSIEYSGGRYKKRMLYKIFSLLSLISSFTIFIMVVSWCEAIFDGYPLENEYLLTLAAPIIWVSFDLFRGDLASPARIQYNFSDGESKEINGELPDGILHTGSLLFLMFGLLLVTIFVMDWVTKRTPLIGDIFGWSLLGFIVYILLQLLILMFRVDGEVAGIESFDVPDGLTHMYFATMSLRSNLPLIQIEKQITSRELDEIRERLLRHETIISSVVSASDIFEAPSPSLGVLAIRVSTETIMRHACDNIGITWKPNARPTLESYVQRYGSKQELDSRIRSYLENIREMGNRAAHDFNLDWGEFKISLDQFCEIVSWYSDSFDSKHESE
ncbi:MAG: hypothetical protein CMA11_00495 [Euryarchaeota archaeon]|nr:hypothetical protein [Euryarchaeota archaeon]